MMLWISFAFLPYLQTAAEPSWQYYEKKAIIEYDEEMFDFAIENFEACLRLNPKSDKSYYYLGHIYLKRGRHRRALSYYHKALDINNDLPKIHYQAGEIYDYLQKFDKARYHFETALSQDNSDHLVHIGLCRIYSIEGKYQLADSHFQKAYTLYAGETLPMLKSAREMRDRRKFSSALVLLDRALKVNPAHRELYYEKSSILRNRGEYRRAIATLERLKYYRPHETLAYVHIANIYYAQRILKNRKLDTDAAIANIKKAIEYSPDDIRNYELLEELYKRNGYEDEYKRTRQLIEKKLNEEIE